MGDVLGGVNRMSPNGVYSTTSQGGLTSISNPDGKTLKGGGFWRLSLRERHDEDGEPSGRIRSPENLCWPHCSQTSSVRKKVVGFQPARGAGDDVKTGSRPDGRRVA